MTSWVEGSRSFFLGSQATILEDEREIASSWASKHVVQNPAYKWILGRFVEADRANNNRQLFGLKGLQMNRPSIQHAPMNMNHAARRVVGAYVATDLIYPNAMKADAMPSDMPEDPEDPNMMCPYCGEMVDPADCPDGKCPDCGAMIASEVAYMELGKDFSQEKRNKLAKTGEALPDGSFPIENESDLHNAISAFGRAKDKAAAKAHIIKRAHALGLSAVLPPKWSQSAAVSDSQLNPYIDALGVFWKHYFPDEYRLVEAAAKEGRLYYSMECIPREIQCTGNGGCGATFEYAGRQSPTYCAHLNETSSDKNLIDPWFTAGAILVPPAKPGWSNADVRTLVAAHSDLAESIYDGVAGDLSHLSAPEWESLMGEILYLATTS